MGGIKVLFFAVLLIGLWVVYVSFLYRPRKGKFKAIGETETAILFQTDFGLFRFDKRRALLQITSRNGDVSTVPFQNITGIKYRAREDYAPALELVRGIDFWDFFPKYMDVVTWYSIDFATTDKQVIPFFLVGLYDPREPIMILADLEKWFASMLGIYIDIDSYARSVYEHISDEMKRLGVAVREN